MDPEHKASVDDASTFPSGNPSKTAASVASSQKSRFNRDRDDTQQQEASERRRIWAMAAASAAEMIKELNQKDPPQFDSVTKVFAPITPTEWADKRMALEVLRESDETQTEEVSDAQIAEELFYDPDANDDDLGMFLSPTSDKDLKELYPGGSSGQIFKGKGAGGGLQRRSGGPAMGAIGLKEAPTEKPTDKIRRKSSAAPGVDGMERRKSSVKQAGSGSGVNTSDSSIKEGAELGESRQSHENSRDLMQENRKSKGGDGEEMTDGPSNMNRRQSQVTQSSLVNSSDDFYNAYDDNISKAEDETQDEVTEESELMEMYYPADVNINVDEALVGLEDLLDDFKLEARITDRFKYKLINKYSLLLQALITYQERETETITHLQTKRKILGALHQFVRTEAEAAAKAVVADDEKEEEHDEEQALDLVGKHDEGEKEGDGEKKDNQGLSIEEMPAATIRETLLNQKNRLDVLESIKKVHVLQLKQLEFERTLLNLHYSKMVKPSDLSKEIKDGRRQVNDLQLEISSIHQEMGLIQNEIRIQEKHVAEEEKSVEKLELEALTKQGEVQVLANKPIHIAKEADREAQKLEQLQDTHDNLCTRFMDSMEIFRANQAKVDVLQVELTNLTKMEIKLNQQKKIAMKDYDGMITQMDNLMSREHVMLDRATLLTERMQAVVRTKKKMVEEQHRMFNEANKSLREAQRLERAIKMAADAFLNAKLAYDKMRSAFDAVRPNEQNNQWEKLSRMLQREIFNLKGTLDKKLDEANYKSNMVAKLQAKLNALYDQHVASGKQLQDLIRTTVRKRREREEKSEQCIKLELQIQRIVLEKKTREIAINDCLRAEKIIFKQLSQMQKMFNQLKMEKSMIVNELSNGRQILQETRMKIDDVTNKLNAYITQTQLFESMTKEKYYIILNARIKRDSIKSDAMRSRQKFRFYRDQKLELLLNTKTLRREAERQKHESVTIRKSFERATNMADDFAIKYRIRMEEICTFHEFIYCYRKILLRGSEEITIREMEKSKLNSLYEETRKHVFIVQMNQPDESDYFTKIEHLREKFYRITDTRRELEVKLNEDDNQSRVREIDFDQMKQKENVEVLEEKLDLQEEYLAIRDVIGLEKTLLENHLTKITEDSLEQALYLKDFFGEHVKAITNIRRQLNNLSQQMEGFICENAIAASQADIAETHFNHCKEVLEKAESRWKEGLPPTDEMEEEWKRLEWRKIMFKRANENYKKPGFFRQAKPWNGTQIQANRWCMREKRRELEDPSLSVLGWRFSAVSDPLSSRVNAHQSNFACRYERSVTSRLNMKTGKSLRATNKKIN